jgi:hypothetical protein
MKYIVGDVICLPSFIKIGSGIQKSLGGDTHTHADRQHRFHEPTIISA